MHPSDAHVLTVTAACVAECAPRGAQIFLLDTQEKGRWAAGGAAWKEDLQWARRLSEGWDLGRVRQARRAPPAAPASA
jgi:hypothetical protein